MGFKQQRVNRKFHQAAGTAAASGHHTQNATVESSPSKRKSRARKQVLDPSHQVYSSQDHGRSSIGASYSQHSKNNAAQFSAVKMVSAFEKTESAGRKNNESRNSLITTL